MVQHCRHIPRPTGTRIPAGLTLVELIVVMLVVGVLAAVAFPRFFETSSDARFSKMDALFSSFQSGTRYAHTFWTARAQPPNGMMTVQGQPVPKVNDWPSPAGALSILSAGNPPPFVPVMSGEELEVRESPERPQCRFIYRAPASAGALPEFVNEVTRSNCAD